MTMRASYVIDHELGYEAVVFGDESAEDGLSVQRTLEPDEQDFALGMDTYCLCLSSGPTVYGGVTGWSAHHGEITLRLNEKAASVLGVQDELKLQPSEHELRSVVPHLLRLLDS